MGVRSLPATYNSEIMTAINVFNSTVVLHHCNDRELYSNETIRNSVNFVFSLDEVRNNIDSSQKGNAFSTCPFWEKFPLNKLPGGEGLYEWVTQKILESSDNFGITDPSKISFGRTWANIMFQGCEGTCHSHPLNIDGVAIFYANVPANGSELVFIKNGIDGTYISNYNDTEIMRQRVISGDLLIHKPNLPHAVSKHYSQEPRICFIYEFKYH